MSTKDLGHYYNDLVSEVVAYLLELYVELRETVAVPFMKQVRSRAAVRELYQRILDEENPDNRIKLIQDLVAQYGEQPVTDFLAREGALYLKRTLKNKED